MMDKLKAVLKYQFWILLGLAVIVPIVGWGYSRSGLIADALARTNTLKEFDNKLTVTGTDPNSEWARKLGEINKLQLAEVRRTWRTLYERQEKLMTWPGEVKSANLTNADQSGNTARDIYQRVYPRERNALGKIVKPVDEAGNGLVDLWDVLPHPEAEWGVGNSISAEDVFAAQEDLWLVTCLLTVIAQVNEDSTSQLDAPIRQIQELILRGGSKGGAGGAGEPMMRRGGDAVDDGVMNIRLGMMARRGGAGMDEDYGGGTAAAPAVDVKFDPTDELGPEVPTPESEAALAATRGNTASLARRMQRYVEEQPEWKTRGFYMEVVMDHRKVPDLLVALANANWPVRVLRVHQGDLKQESLVSATPETQSPLAGRGGGGRGGGGVAAGYAAALAAQMRGGGGGMNMSTRGPTRGPAVTSATTEQALDDYMLATVALDGLITIFKKPPEEPIVPETTTPTTPTTAAAAAPETEAPTSPEAEKDQPAPEAVEEKKEPADAPPAEKPESP